MRTATRVSSLNALFNDWLERSASDIAMLSSRTPQGIYPYAGVPWFSTTGRDGLVTAMETLWVAPQIARGVPGYLAAHQADRTDPVRDAEPGKILHEVRLGEMAATGEVPFARYYGSHDATPLFVMLAAQHWRQTDDAATARRLWPHVERALEWMDRYGDLDGDGFLEYARSNERVDPAGVEGLARFDLPCRWPHGDRTDRPRAAAYAYAARRGRLSRRLATAPRRDQAARGGPAARLRCGLLGRGARHLRAGARRREAALPGTRLERRPRAVVGDRASRARDEGGRCAALRRLVLRLGDSDGGRRRGARYNPISYHNGSIWPHDNAIAAMGSGLATASTIAPRGC